MGRNSNFTKLLDQLHLHKIRGRGNCKYHPAEQQQKNPLNMDIIKQFALQMQQKKNPELT